MEFVLNDWKRELTDEEIIADIQVVAKNLQTDYISISTYKNHGKYSQTAIQGHFGTWKNALRVAGLRTERNANELKLISDEEYLADLRRVAQLMQKETVPYNDYKKYGNFAAEYMYKRFNTDWNTILERAGLQSTGFTKKG